MQKVNGIRGARSPTRCSADDLPRPPFQATPDTREADTVLPSQEPFSDPIVDNIAPEPHSELSVATVATDTTDYWNNQEAEREAEDLQTRVQEARYIVATALSNYWQGVRLLSEVQSTDATFGDDSLLEDAAADTKEARNEVEKALDAELSCALQLLYPFVPRQGQLTSLRVLLADKDDLVLCARTSFGKSLILQSASVLVEGTITLIILPLDQIGKEQTEKISKIGGRPLFINSESLPKLGRSLLRRLQDGHYTHILISPELSLNKKLHAVLTNPSFKKRLHLVVIDEAHLVGLWGKDFRTEYSRLRELRALCGSEIPWLACSATLSDRGLSELQDGAGFSEAVRIHREPINRPELLIQIGTIPERTYRSYSSLRFIIDQACEPSINSDIIDPKQKTLRKATPTRIPKTIVFVDSRKDPITAAESLRQYLSQVSGEYTQSMLKTIIRVYHRNTSKFDKDWILNEFNKPGEESTIRVIIATESIGLGVDIVDVRVIVQYGLPIKHDLAVLWQRGGRACRDGQPGSFILLFQQWAWGERSKISQESANQREKKDDKLRRGMFTDEIDGLINGSGCIRDVILDHFNEPQGFRHMTDRTRCCSRCNANYVLRDTDRQLVSGQKGGIYTAFRRDIRSALENWALDVAKKLLVSPAFEPTPYIIITQRELTNIASTAECIANIDDLREAAGTWRHLDEYGEDVIRVIDKCKQNSNRRTLPNKTAAAGKGSQLQVSQGTVTAATSAWASQLDASIQQRRRILQEISEGIVNQAGSSPKRPRKS